MRRTSQILGESVKICMPKGERDLWGTLELSSFRAINQRARLMTEEEAIKWPFTGRKKNEKEIHVESPPFFNQIDDSRSDMIKSLLST